MSKKKRLMLIALAVLLAGLLLWRLIPQSIYSIAGTEKARVHRAFSTVHTFAYEAVPAYHVDTRELSEPQAAQLMEILEGKGCRPSLRNLIPWKKWDSGVKGEAILADVVLIWDHAPEKACHFSILGSQYSGTHISSQGKIYYPADGETLTKLRDFAAQYGEASE